MKRAARRGGGQDRDGDARDRVRIEIEDLERPPTLAVELSADGKRLVYTADTGPDWSPEVFGAGADLVLSEATFQQDNVSSGIHLSARQAGERARAAGARRLMLTHLWPGLDPTASVVEGSEAFGREVLLAAPHHRTRI